MYASNNYCVTYLQIQAIKNAMAGRTLHKAAVKVAVVYCIPV